MGCSGMKWGLLVRVRCFVCRLEPDVKANEGEAFCLFSTRVAADFYRFERQPGLKQCVDVRQQTHVKPFA
jgi:hypothetical protein